MKLFTSRQIFKLTEKPLLCLRINTLRIKEEELVKRLQARDVILKKIPFLKYSYFVEKSQVPLGATPEYLLGHYFLHDAASQAACEALDPQAGETVLDMAASPGGKTTYLSQLMDNKGVIVAVEVNKKRLKRLKSNIMRMGCENVIAVNKDASEFKHMNIKFDRVLLDAPCTGTGTASKSPEALKKGKMDLASCTTTQRNLIEVAIKVLKKRGTLVYSTCSLLPEENEIIVDEMVKKYHIELQTVKAGSRAITEPYGKRLMDDIKKASRFYPWEHSTQGFFIAKMKKV